MDTCLAFAEFFALKFVYLGLFIFSAVFAVLAFIFGHDTDTDHDVGHDIGGHDLGEGIPSIFSGRVLSLFILGFSGMGLIATYGLEWGAVGSISLGLVGGVVLGAIAWGLMAFFFREQASSMATSDDYVGLDARVSSNIPAGGAGEISVSVKTQLKTIFATAADGAAIPEGRTVKIVSMSGATATVTPV